MKYNIEWTEEAKVTFENIFNFILENWGEITAAKFIQQADKIFKLLIDQPYIYEEVKENLFRGIINFKTSFYYTIKRDKIYLVFFWDNRQNPII